MDANGSARSVPIAYNPGLKSPIHSKPDRQVT